MLVISEKPSLGQSFTQQVETRPPPIWEAPHQSMPSEEIVEPSQPTMKEESQRPKPSEELESTGPKVAIIDGRRVVVLGGDSSESQRVEEHQEEEEFEEEEVKSPLALFPAQTIVQQQVPSILRPVVLTPPIQ